MRCFGMILRAPANCPIRSCRSRNMASIASLIRLSSLVLAPGSRLVEPLASMLMVGAPPFSSVVELVTIPANSALSSSQVIRLRSADLRSSPALRKRTLAMCVS